jgi:hypothetical protein
MSIEFAVRGSERLQDNTRDSKILKVCHTAVTIRDVTRVRERNVLGRVAAHGAVCMALGCAGACGQRPQLVSNVGASNIEHRLFDSAEHLTDRAPAPKTTARFGCSLGTAGAKLRTPIDFCMQKNDAAPHRYRGVLASV